MHYCTTVRFQEDTFNTPMFEHCINEHGGINDDGQRTQQVFFVRARFRCSATFRTRFQYPAHADAQRPPPSVSFSRPRM